MDPRLLFPVLAVLFAALAGWQFWRTRRWRGGAAAWGWMALCFAAVSLWLHGSGSGAA